MIHVTPKKVKTLQGNLRYLRAIFGLTDTEMDKLLGYKKGCFANYLKGYCGITNQFYLACIAQTFAFYAGLDTIQRERVKEPFKRIFSEPLPKLKKWSRKDKYLDELGLLDFS